MINSSLWKRKLIPLIPSISLARKLTACQIIYRTRDISDPKSSSHLENNDHYFTTTKWKNCRSCKPNIISHSTPLSLHTHLKLMKTFIKYMFVLTCWLERKNSNSSSRNGPTEVEFYCLHYSNKITSCESIPAVLKKVKDTC